MYGFNISNIGHLNCLFPITNMSLIQIILGQSPLIISKEKFPEGSKGVYALRF